MADSVLDDVNAVLSTPKTATNDVAAVRQVLGLPDPSQQPGAISAGLRAGVREAGGLTGAAAAAVGKFSGLEGLEQWGTQTAQEQFAKAREVGRSDLETAPWREGGGGLAGALPWLGYQAAKQVPQLAAGVAAGMLVPEAAVPAALARAGAALPEFLGGGAIKTATTEAAREAAMQTGRGLAKQAIGQEVAGLPAAAGSMYQEAMERPGGPTKEDAAKALGMAPFYSALDAAAPAVEVSRLAKGLTGNLAKRVATGVATDAIMEMPQEAAQTAMELSFRPDLSTTEKASQIVDAALTGGAVGGVFGGVSSLRQTKNIPPNRLSDDDLLDSVDHDLGRMPTQPAAPAAAAPAAPAETEAAPPAVEGAVTTAPAEPAEPAAPPMMAQIEEAEAPVREAAARQTRMDQLHRTLATEIGKDNAQNRTLVQNVLGSVETIPDAVNSVLDKIDQYDAQEKKLPAALRKVSTALGITNIDGSPRNLEADISTLTQQLTAAQTPQERQAITDQIDKLDTQRQILASAAERRAPVAEAAAPAPAPEEMIAPPEPAAPPTPAMQAAQAANISARSQPNFIRGFEAATNKEIAPTRGAALTGYQAGLEFMKQQEPTTAAAPTTEIPSAVQEPSPAGVYVQPTAEVSGAVGERDTEGREAAGARVEAAPEIQGEVTAAPQEVAPAPLAAPAPSKTAAAFMQQQGIKQLSPEERVAARARQQAETEAYLAKRQAQIRQATARNMGRGGVTAAPVAPKGMTPEEFLARRNRERPAMGLPGEESELDRDVSSLIENNASGKQVLDFLGQNGKTEFDRLYAQHLSRLGVSPSMQFADVNDPNLQIDREAAADRTIYGSYNVEQDRVNLYERANAAQIALHESTHAATDRAIRTSSPSAQKLKDVFNEFKARPEKFAQATPAYDDESEFISEAFSNPDFREFLKTQKVGPKNLWEKFKDAVFKLLRMPQRARTVFDQVMEIGEPLFRENQQITMEDVYRATGEAPLTESPLSVNKLMGEVATNLGKGLDKFNRTASAVEATRRTALGWQSITHMVARYGDLFTAKGTNWLQKYADYNQERAAVAARMSQLFKIVYDDYTSIETKTPAAAETIRKLMALTEFNIDWRKTWAEQSWLHNEKNAADLKELHSNMRREGSRLDASAKELFDRLEAVNNVSRYAQMSLTLYNTIASDPNMSANIAGSDVDPIDEFLRKSALHENPAEAQTYWRETLEKQLAAAKPYIEQQRSITKDKTKTGLYVHSAAERDKANRILKPLKGLHDSTVETMKVMQQSPNFHLGRFGDYMVTFKIKNDKGVADPEAKIRVAAAMDAAGVQAQLSPENRNPTVFVRVETQEQAENLRKLAIKMQDRGWADAEYAPKAGLRTEDKFNDVMNPKWLAQYIQVLQSEMFDDEGLDGEAAAQAVKNRKDMVSHARELYLNMLPDNAMAKVLTQRKNISGYSKDMMRSFAFRHQIGMNTIANLATMHNIADTLTEMRRVVNDAKTGPVSETVKLQNIFGEISRRESERSMRPQNSFWDSVRAFNHAYFLGASPSYVLVNMTQPGVLLWPELSKQHGFVKSAKALASVTPTAFKVMKAVLTTGKSADAIITEKSLKASGVDEATADFIMRVANTGNLDLGSTSRELGRVVEGEIDSRVDQALRWAAAAGYYSETFTRLSAALAARDLYANKTDTEGMMAYVNKTINESMLNYSSWNTGRQTGKMGIAGEYTPVMFSFMTYQFQVLEKMYRELRDAFGGSEEAQRFLAGHLGALTVLAGSLGLPFASVAARAFDALKDAFGDDEEPSDAKSAWRNFLAEMFGKEVGEVLARGAPRALGFDISGRVGEADLLPFSRFLTDRRDVRDAAKDAALRTLGSPVSMLLNIYDGTDKIMQGNVVEGLQEMVPNAIKGPVAAYKMAADGRYVDNKGRELPMEPGARDVLMQALGFTPAAKAEYQEASMAQTVRTGLLTREAANLRDQLADAIIDQSPDRPELMRRAQEFDRAHPDRPILKTIASVVKRRRTGLAQAKALGTPIGVKPQDIGGRELTRYMNVDMQ